MKEEEMSYRAWCVVGVCEGR